MPCKIRITREVLSPAHYRSTRARRIGRIQAIDIKGQVGRVITDTLTDGGDRILHRLLVGLVGVNHLKIRA